MGAKKGIPTGPDNKLRRSPRWTGQRLDTYLAALEATGNARAAAEAIGMNRRTIERRRAKDASFARDCAAALAAADRRLKGAAADTAAQGGRGGDGPDPFEMIRRGPNGKAQIAAAGKRRWCGRTDTVFIAELRRTGNMSAAARAAGFSLNAALDRRRKWPDFARRIEEALEDAEIVLEFRLASLGSDSAGDEAGAEEEKQPPATTPSNGSIPISRSPSSSGASRKGPAAGGAGAAIGGRGRRRSRRSATMSCAGSQRSGAIARNMARKRVASDGPGLAQDRGQWDGCGDPPVPAQRPGASKLRPLRVRSATGPRGRAGTRGRMARNRRSASARERVRAQSVTSPSRPQRCARRRSRRGRRSAAAGRPGRPAGRCPSRSSQRRW